MRVSRERRAELQAEALERIGSSAHNVMRRYQLMDCVQAYSDLDPAEWHRLQALRLTDKYKAVERWG